MGATLHLLASLDNLMLCLVLIWRWRAWKWTAAAQVVSIGLLLAHNWQMRYDWTGYVRWWNSFDIANVLVEMLYLIDLRERRLGFSVFASLGIYTCVEYAVAEAGYGALARQMLIVRAWTDCFAMYLLAWIIMRSGGNKPCRTSSVKTLTARMKSRTRSTRRLMNLMPMMMAVTVLHLRVVGIHKHN